MNIFLGSIVALLLVLFGAIAERQWKVLSQIVNKRQARKAHRNRRPATASPQPSGRQEARRSDLTIVPGLDDQPVAPIRPVAVTEGQITYSADYVGQVFLALGLAAGQVPADVQVLIQWGSYSAGFNLSHLTEDGYVVTFDKRNPEENDAVLTVKTSVPTWRLASTSNPLPAQRPEAVSNWTEAA